MSEHQHANDATDGASPPEGETTSEFSSADFLSPDSKIEEALSERINLYYDQPLELFPYGERHTKPDRFHVLFMRQIEERFPDDGKMRREVAAYGRLMFRWLRAYMFGKRLVQALALAGLWSLAVWGPGLLKEALVGGAAQTAGAGLAMLAVLGVFAGVSAIVFTQYRLGLENRSYSLSRGIVQYTRTLQNDYTTIRALPDQAETHFQSDGPAWGRRSAFLTRLMMWIAARMEYLEKYIQAEMWRVRRERYWMDWAGGGPDPACPGIVDLLPSRRARAQRSRGHVPHSAGPGLDPWAAGLLGLVLPLAYAGDPGPDEARSGLLDSLREPRP